MRGAWLRAGLLALANLALTLACRAGEPIQAEVRREPPPALPDPQWGRGPLEVRDPFLLSLSRLSPWMRSPRVLRGGEVEVGVRGVWANSWAFDRDRFVVDGELRQATAFVRVGLLERVELGLNVPWEWRGGGVGDGPIEGFHELFQLGQQDRERRPRDGYLVAGVERDGSRFEHDHRGEGFSDLVPEARLLLLRGDARWPALTATVRLRLPTGARHLLLSTGVDVSVALDASKRVGPVILYATAAYTYHARRLVHGVEVARHRLFGGAGFEVELGSSASIVAHVWTESVRETDLHGDRPSLLGHRVSYVVTGVKLEPVDGLLLELGVLENILAHETSADVGLVASVSYRF